LEIFGARPRVPRPHAIADREVLDWNDALLRVHNVTDQRRRVDAAMLGVEGSG
jgi:hypothetical protein